MSATDPYAILAPHYDKVLPASLYSVEQIEKYATRSFLDVGCGTGRLLREIHTRHPDWRLEGVDASPGMIRLAERAVQGTKIKLTVGDCRELPEDEFDVIGCFGDCINHLLTEADVLSAFKAARTALRPNGVYLFDTGKTRSELPPFVNCPVSWKNGKVSVQVTQNDDKIEHEITVGSAKSVVHERQYSVTTVGKLLEHAGFKGAHVQSRIGHWFWTAFRTARAHAI